MSEYVTSVILLNWSVIVWFSKGDALSTQNKSVDNALTWAFIFGILSFVRILILYVNGALRRSPHLRSGLSFFTCFAWFQLTVIHFTSDHVTTGAGIYPVLLALDFYNAYRIAIEARITDEGYKDGSDT
jgi:hypothetical protein